MNAMKVRQAKSNLIQLPTRALLGHSRERRVALSKIVASLASGVTAFEAALGDARYEVVWTGEANIT